MAADETAGEMAQLSLQQQQASIPQAPPMPASLTSSPNQASPYSRANAPAAATMSTTPPTRQRSDEQKELSFEEQQMANLPAGLLTTALKPGTKKPFSYTPVGLSAADLKSPSTLRKERLSSGASTPAPHGPTHYRVFSGIRAPSDTDLSETGAGSELPPRPHTPSLPVKSDEDKEQHRRYRNENPGPPLQSRSFRILQWMTGADQDDGTELTPPPTGRQAGVEPDEIHFGGLRPADSIPSRSFQYLNRSTSSQTPTSPPSYSPVPQNHEPQFRTEFSEEEGAALRYQGATIPSRSFHMLQNMTDTAGPNTFQQRSPSWSSGGSPGLQQIPDPSPHDFKHTGPQYSTYQLPEKRSFNVNPVLEYQTRPVYSSSVNVTPQTNYNSNMSRQVSFGGANQPSTYSTPQSFHRPVSAAAYTPTNHYGIASPGTSDF